MEVVQHQVVAEVEAEHQYHLEEVVVEGAVSLLLQTLSVP